MCWQQGAGTATKWASVSKEQNGQMTIAENIIFYLQAVRRQEYQRRRVVGKSPVFDEAESQPLQT